jgi:hypothetical protein
MFQLLVYRRTDYLLYARRILPAKITVLSAGPLYQAQAFLLIQNVLPAPYQLILIPDH